MTSTNAAIALVGRSYQNFINSVSEESRHQYGYILKKYMAFHNLTDNADELLKQDPKTIEQQIIDYIISQEGLSRATQQRNKYLKSGNLKKLHRYR
jgi:hypothetical protein